jgi:hypothetical protein
VRPIENKDIQRTEKNRNKATETTFLFFIKKCIKKTIFYSYKTILCLNGVPNVQGKFYFSLEKFPRCRQQVLKKEKLKGIRATGEGSS